MVLRKPTPDLRILVLFVLTKEIGMTESKDTNSHKPDGREAVPTAAYGGAALGPGAQIGPYKLLRVRTST